MDLLTQISLAIFSIMPGNYSGITHVDGNGYAIVDDKDKTDGFKLLTLDIDPENGALRDARMTEPSGMSQRRAAGKGMYRDCEGVAFFDHAKTVFVSGEEDQRIAEYTLEGEPTDRELAVPASMQRDKIAGNLGFEALTYNAQTHRFWTTMESTLLADGPRTALNQKATANRLRLQSFGDDLRPATQLAYMMDLPTANGTQGTYAHGVPSMVAMDDGRLIVMEREAYVTPSKLGSFCTIKLYEVDTREQYQISETTNLATLPREMFLKKTLLASFTTHLRLGKLNFANYEGMCLGPTLTDGRHTLILISDSQGGMGNALFHLKDYLKVVIF